MKILLIAAVLVAQPALAQAKQQILKASLEREVTRVVRELDGVMGVGIQDLTSGDTIFVNGDEIFPTASVIKIAVLYELHEQAREGRLKLDEPHVVRRAEKVGGGGVLEHFGDGTATLSLADIAALMISLSDNTATNILIDRVGMDAVNRRMAGLGLKNTLLRRKMMDLRAAVEGRENVSTPREMLKLLETVRARPDVLEVLKLPKTSALRAGIPPRVPVANKTGSLEGVRGDCGIVLLEGRPFALALLTTFLKSDQEGETAITRVARLAYDTFDRLARSGEYGRPLR